MRVVHDRFEAEGTGQKDEQQEEPNPASAPHDAK
jgi:hypothetical protein